MEKLEFEKAIAKAAVKVAEEFHRVKNAQYKLSDARLGLADKAKEVSKGLEKLFK